VTLASLLQAIAAQSFRPGRDFSVVAFGIDPKEKPVDSASSLGRLLADFPAFPRSAISGLTGKADDIAAVTKALGYRYAWDPQLGQYDHVAATAVLTAGGRLTHWLYGIAPDPQDLKLALTEAGQGQIGSWTDQVILLCYHYDPVTGRYGGIIWIALRTFGVLTLVAILGVIGHALYRERHPARGRRA
jgi:protein SCO1/2